MPKILIVEDEHQMANALQDNFEIEGYETDIAFDGEEGLNKILDNTYDLILLDVMLPKISGFEICKTIRQKGVTVPVIMLTARGTDYDKVRGLEYGADDYVTKPFSLIELLARVKAVLRRGIAIKTTEENQNLAVIGKLTVDFNNYMAFVDGREVKMSHTEFEILKYFYENKNQVVKREDIMKKVYGIEGDVTSRTIDNFIVKLRQKIENNASNPKYFLTVHGIGYKLIIN